MLSNGIRHAAMAILIVSLAALCPLLVCGQEITNGNNIGLPPNGVFSGSAFDNVQLNNGNLHIEIPLVVLQGRGLSTAYKYVYDNKGGWQDQTHCGHVSEICTSIIEKAPGNTMGWPLVQSLGGSMSYELGKFTCVVGQPSYTVKTNYLFIEANGTKHNFLPGQIVPPGSANIYCPAYGTTLYASDGSGWIMYTDPASGVPTKVVGPDGTVVESTVRDANGNQFALNGTDTLGRPLPTLVLNSGTGKYEFTYYDSSGTSRIIQITRISVPVHTAVCGYTDGDICFEYEGSNSVVSEIEFPNGMKYTFTHIQNSHGEPSNAVLPTGGQVAWTWSPGAGDIGGRQVATRTVTANGQTAQWTYVRDTVADTITMTDPANNATKAYCTISGSGTCLISKIESYQGSTSGTLLKTVTTDHSPEPSSRPIRETTKWNPQNLVTKVETDWETFPMGYPAETITRSNALQKREYAYGTGAPGSLARKTVFNYLHLVNTTYKNLNIVDRPTSKIVYDGASVIKAQTQWTYDGSALLTAPNAPSHDYTGFGTSYLTRGNATQIRNWLSTTGTWLATNNVFDELGNLRTSTDPGSHISTYSYTDDWANSSCVPAGVNTQAYVTQVTNHLGQRVQTRYLPCTGLTERTRDENQILASIWGRIFTYDQMHRTLTVVEADGGQTTLSYNDTAPVSVTTTKKITGSLNLVTTAVRDQLGQVKQTQLTSDPEGAVNADATYDAFGRKDCETNPYRGASPPSSTSTCYQYDALGRITKVIPPDGTASANNVSTLYAGNCTTVTDQAGKQRRSCTDALGRLIQVDEPSVSTGGSGAPGTGYVTISGSEQFVELENCLEFPPFTCTPYNFYDTGSVSITVAGFTKNASYNQNSTAGSIASALANAFNNDAASPVTAVAVGAVVNLTSKTGQAHTLSASSLSYSPEYFTPPSFTATPSGSTLDGGGNPPPGDLSTPMTTAYQYDTLDNLTRVDQKGGVTDTTQWRTRTFTYDSLSRLTQGVNPESGTINYTYDVDGNLLTKVAPKPNQTGALTVTTTYTYDALHRLTQKSYNDGATATVKYGYDAAALTGCSTAPPSLTILNGKGRRTAMCHGALPNSGAVVWSYDSEGSVLTEKRTINGSSAVTKTISYTYNLDGSLATLVYPSGRTITYAPSAAGRTLSAIDVANNVNYATAAFYAPHGALSSLKNGVVAGFTGITTTNTFNNRLQPWVLSAATTSSTVFSFTYDFNFGTPSAPINNGNVKQIRNDQTSDRTQNFTYDELNRIKKAETQANSGTYCWGQNFAGGIDIWGNLKTIAVSKCNPTTLSVSVNTKNQINSSGFVHDSAGNMTNSGAGVMTYDAENRMTVAAGVTYTYDGDGKRVKKSNGKLYWTGMGSDTLAESDLAGTLGDEHIYFNGKRVARRTSAAVVYYYFGDHLGTSRKITGATGGVCYDADYYPYGGERVYLNTCAQNYKFTGKERDTETGLDYFGARYYGSNWGRWTTPDWSNKPSPVPYATLLDPRTLNRYSYARNNPLKYVDDGGHDDVTYEENQYDYGKTIMFYQKKTETKDIKDADGNVIGQETTVTITNAKYEMAAGLPYFVGGNQTVTTSKQDRDGNTTSTSYGETQPMRDESTALTALGRGSASNGASRVYEAIAGGIRLEGQVRFAGTVASGALAAPAIASSGLGLGAAARAGDLGAAIKHGGELLWEVIREVGTKKAIDSMDEDRKAPKPEKAPNEKE